MKTHKWTESELRAAIEKLPMFNLKWPEGFKESWTSAFRILSKSISALNAKDAK